MISRKTSLPKQSYQDDLSDLSEDIPGSMNDIWATFTWSIKEKTQKWYSHRNGWQNTYKKFTTKNSTVPISKMNPKLPILQSG